MLPITIEAFPSYFVFSISNKQSTEQKQFLILFRCWPICCKFVEKSTYDEMAESENISDSYQIYGILGVISFESYHFLIVLTSTQEIGSIINDFIYKITGIKIIPIENIRITGNEILEEVSNRFVEGNYFSYTYDLSSNSQRTFRMSKSNLHAKIYKDKRFVWNYNMILPLLDAKISDPWVICIIQGYVGIFSLNFPPNIQVILISRRKAAMAGTIDSSRGIDENGDVANFVETEQIIIINEEFYSFIQIRGSVPCFWCIDHEESKVILTRDQSVSFLSFKKHFEHLKNDYENLFCLNLLSPRRPDEALLIKTYEACLKAAEDQKILNIKYFYFDYNIFMKDHDIQQLDQFFSKKFDNIINYFKYFSKHLKLVSEPSFQIGVIRTNCYECLNRTNIIQHRIARIWAYNLLRNTEIVNDYNNKQVLLKNFDELWAINGNDLSLQYASTESTTAEISKTGKTSIFGDIANALTGVRKYMNSNPNLIKLKQKSIDIIQCKTTFSPSITHKIKEIKINPQNNDNINPLIILIITWNAAGRMPLSFTPISDLVESLNDKNIKIISFGIQEMVPLTVGNLLEDNMGMDAQKWRKQLESIFYKNGFKLAHLKFMFGLLLTIWVKEEFLLNGNISSIEDGKYKTGFGGGVGNKGAIMIKFRFNNLINLFFTNCHLASGQSNFDERYSDLKEIYENGYAGSDLRANSKKLLMRNADVLFLFGDLNFRVNLKAKDAIQSIQSQNLDYLKKSDQLIQKILKHPTKRFNLPLNEQEIYFFPTFKFENNSDSYYTKDNHVPSWCDRIMWKVNEDINIINNNNNFGNVYPMGYSSINSLKESDHRAVFALFRIGKEDPKKIVEIKLDEIKSEEEIIENYQLDHIPSPLSEPFTLTNQNQKINQIDIEKKENKEFKENKEIKEKKENLFMTYSKPAILLDFEKITPKFEDSKLIFSKSNKSIIEMPNLNVNENHEKKHSSSLDKKQKLLETE